MGRFKDDFKRGQIGEELVAKIVAEKLELEVIHRDGYEKGNDILFKCRDTSIKVEVKTDWNGLKSGNILIEVWHKLSQRKKGWIQYEDAHIHTIVFMEGDKAKLIYFYDFKALQNYIFNSIFDNEGWTTDKYGEMYAKADEPDARIVTPSQKSVERFCFAKYDVERGCFYDLKYYNENQFIYDFSNFMFRPLVIGD